MTDQESGDANDLPFQQKVDFGETSTRRDTGTRAITPGHVVKRLPFADVNDFVFGVDLDGVCADYTIGFREIVAEQRGVDPESLPLERSWSFAEWGLTPDEFSELHQFAVSEKRMMATLPVFEGCADALWRLSDAGIWIRIITHRLYANWGHAVAVSDTVTWLDNEQIPYRDICFLGAKPQVEADVYIDDASHNITALRATGNPAIVFDQPYNRELGGLRAHTWNEVEDIVMDLAAKSDGVQPQLPGIDAGADRLLRRTTGGDAT